MMAICAEVLVFLAVIISKSGYLAFEVSIQTYNSLPVIGEDFTLVCTFTPPTNSRRVTWENGDGIILFSQVCWFYPECGETVSYPSKFRLLADPFSGNLTITNLTKDDGNNYQCKVKSEFAAETSGSSNVQVTTLLPAPPNHLFISGDNFQDGYLNDAQVNVTYGVLHNITCAAQGARPPVVLEWRIPDDVTVVLQYQSDVVQGNSYVSLKAVTITPSRNDQGKNLLCVASHPELQNHLQISINLNVQDSPTIIGFSVHRNVSNANREHLIFTCISDANPPAFIFKWFRNGQILDTDNFPMISSSVVQEGETITRSVLTFRNERVTLRTSFSCMSISSLGNESAVIEIFPLPVPPSQLNINRNYTSASSMLVGWKPGFEGELRQTFSLKFCPNATQEDREECGLLKNLTDASFELKGLKPFTWYRLILWATNSAGQSGALETVASTSPLSPLHYGMNITLNKLTGVLTFSETNTEHSLEETCFFVLGNTTTTPDCLSIEKCIEPGSEVKVDQDVEYLVLTSGRGLCSKPDHPTVIDPTIKGDSSVTGYFITAGVLAFTVVMFSAVGGICLVKKMSARSMILSNTGAIPPIPTSEPPIKQVDQGDYAGTAQELPSHTSKSTTSDYMDMKPIPRTDNDDYVSPSFTRNEFEAVYDNPDMEDEKALQDDQYNDYVSPSFTRKSSGAEFVTTDEKCVQN